MIKMSNNSKKGILFQISDPSLTIQIVKSEGEFDEEEEICESVKNEKSDFKTKIAKSFQNKTIKKLKLDPTLQQPACAKGKQIVI